jgi:hypothetical protein
LVNALKEISVIKVRHIDPDGHARCAQILDQSCRDFIIFVTMADEDTRRS